MTLRRRLARLRAASLAAGLLALAAASVPAAEPAEPSASAAPAAGRIELQRVDLSGAPGMEVVTSIVEVRPGELMPRHIHHGVETMYVLQGATIQMPGQAPRRLLEGSAAVNLRDVPHGGFTVVGDTALKLLTTHVVDKGKPLYDEPH